MPDLENGPFEEEDRGWGSLGLGPDSTPLRS